MEQHKSTIKYHESTIKDHESAIVVLTAEARLVTLTITLRGPGNGGDFVNYVMYTISYINTERVAGTLFYTIFSCHRYTIPVL